MDSIVELQRQSHEEVERFQRALTDLLAQRPPTHKESLSNQHKAAQILGRIQGRNTALSRQYNDQAARQAELDALSAPQQQDDISQFYARLVKIKDHYRKYPDSVADGFELELAGILEAGHTVVDGEDEFEEEDPISLLFSGEEAYGRYLDLLANHASYNNLKHLKKRLTYLQYLDVLMCEHNNTLHTELPRETRIGKDYENYILALHSYLLSFATRTQPLSDVTTEQTSAELNFINDWDAGKIEGWSELPSGPVNASVGSEQGIWCAACQKLYSKSTVYDAHLKSKKHIKATEKLANATETPPPNPNGPSIKTSATVTDASPNHTRSKTFKSALYTHLSASLLIPSRSQLTDTKANVERRFALTARERELEQTEPQNTAPAASAPAEEEEEEEKIYNPLKLPLGWDGKPIPYWLYKLHGLGVEYRCEICSDHVYMGRKNFERHFQESRHAFGMRALGLPNTKHFHEITRIEDALSLAEKLKQEGRRDIFHTETTEELEDDEGNVYNRKTYDDLKKQGLI